MFAQRYDASGNPRGSEFRVNNYTPSWQRKPSVASDPAGNFVVVWTGAFQDGDGSGVFAQRYDASGGPRGAEFQVNTYTTGDQWFPRVALDAVGNFVVVWQGFGPGEKSDGIFARRFDAAGTPRGAEFHVNTYTTDNQWKPSLASDAAGNFVVAWESTGQDGDSWGVFAQRYDAAGAPRGSEFQVNTDTYSWQYLPSVASDAAGNFVVAWDGWRPDGSGNFDHIYAQRYDASGSPRGSQFRVNSATTFWQSQPSVASDTAGNFVVTWYSWEQDGDLGGVFAQRFGGLQPAALAVDASASGGSDGDGILEPGETSVAVAPSWKNVNGATQTFDGGALSFSGPAASGVSYTLPGSSATYGTVANGTTVPCGSCYQVGV